MNLEEPETYNEAPKNKRGKVPEQGKLFYVMYANFEERYGLVSNSMRIYDRALRDISDKDQKFEIFNLFLAKTSEFHGVTQSRDLFNRGIELLDGHYMI